MPLVSRAKANLLASGDSVGWVIIGGFGQHRLTLLAGCVVPDELRAAARRTVLVKKLPVRRSRQDASPCVSLDRNMVGHGLGFALQGETARVESLRHQSVVAHKQEISRGCIDGVGIVAQQQLALFGIERSQIDAAVCARRAVGEVEKAAGDSAIPGNLAAIRFRRGQVSCQR